MLMKSCTAVLLSFIYANSFSQIVNDSSIIRKIASNILANGTAYENLRFLCKKIGPRLSGTTQAEKAVHETARIMKEMGADTVYLQELLVPRWIRGEKEKASIILTSGKEYPLNVCALGNSEPTPKAGIRASVIVVDSFSQLEQLGAEKIKGRIVFYNCKMDQTHINTFLGYRETVPYRTEGPSRAAKLGAIAVIVRSVASNTDDFPHTGLTEYNDSFPKIPAVAISTKDADYLSMVLKRKMVTQVFVRSSCKMMPDVKSYNVVGELRGAEFPDQIITIGGHLDSWDLGEGAHDDGAGCVQSMEIIRVLKSLDIRPKRTVRIVLFMNEENGVRGGRKYAELAKEEGKNFLFALEADAGGFTPRGFGIDMQARQREKILSWKPLFQPYGIHEFNSAGGGADIGFLKPLGTALAGLAIDTQRYFDIHHAGSDVFEAVNRRELHLGAFAMVALVFLVSEYGL